MNEARSSSPRKVQPDDDAVGTSREDRRSLVEGQLRLLLDKQHPDGHFLFECEADSTIPSEYILFRHFLGEIDPEREARIARYILSVQNEDGSWPLYHAGGGHMSATVKAYWALKLIGEDIDSPPLARAREWMLTRGGAATANVFARFMMALYGEIPWRGVPVMPVEIMLLPRWFPFHMSKMAYWSRTVLAPLLILFALRAKARNPTGRSIRELFIVPPEEVRAYNVNPTGSRVGDVFLAIDKVLRFAEPAFPKALRRHAINKAVEFTTERLNGEDGLGGIYPAMAGSVMALRALGYDNDNPDVVTARKAIEKLVVQRGDGIYYQPCLSPVWDTALAAHAMLESAERDDPELIAALDWLKDKQILDVVGDWAVRRPGVRPGGWAFQYANPHYPDVDDTAVVALAMHRQGSPRYKEAIDRACEWLAGMQAKSGGWGAFEPENDHLYLNSIPFADHGALLDPPTVDVTARCVGCLGQVDADYYAEHIARGIAFIKREQEAEGTWYGRWGANYVYGTWSALVALKGAGEDMQQPYIRKAVKWLKDHQRPDGGWGEGLESYERRPRMVCDHSTASQTSWALLALMSADEVMSPEVERGIAYLQTAEREGWRWKEDGYTGTGFPRVFYLKYHGYAAYFPIWALARHDNLVASNDRQVKWGI